MGTTDIDTVQLGMGWFPDQSGNGLDRVYHALYQYLPRVGVGVSGLVTGRPDSHNGGCAPHVFAEATVPLPKRLMAVRREAKALLQEQSPDLVASHFALYTSPLLDLLSDVPLVIHFHGPWALESAAEGDGVLKRRMKAGLEKIVYAFGSRFVVLSEAFQRVLTNEYGIPSAKIDIVPGGVETARFDTGGSRRDARGRLEWPVDRRIIVCVRRLVRRVGLEQLIDAVQDVRRRHPDMLLMIAGKGPLKNDLEQRVEELGLGRHVHLLGYVSDEVLPFIFRAAELSVVPSQSLEGFGLIAVESLAAGTPVLVTPVGGLPEVVRGLSDHLVLSDTRARTIGEGLTAALNGEFPLPSPAACQRYAATRFDWSVIARQVRAVYEEVLA